MAKDANLISIKASDEAGNSTVLDVIYGIQFAVDHKAEYNIRVLNLSLESTVAESYKTDPLDAAVEAAWFKGIVVVAAAGNRGTGADAVKYAPGNDPYVISVGAVDDQATRSIYDDRLASWSSRGTTQDGVAKPDVYAPGSGIVSNLAPGSAFTALCATCIVDGQYIRAGGTSMAAPMVSGTVALLLELNPDLTPNQVKGLLMTSGRALPEGVDEISAVQADKQINQAPSRAVNQGLTPSTFIDPATGEIDYTPLELEPLLLERRRRAAALELEPLELEPLELELGEPRDRRSRPHAVELEPLQLVDQLDQVAQAARHDVGRSRRSSGVFARTSELWQARSQR